MLEHFNVVVCQCGASFFNFKSKMNTVMVQNTGGHRGFEITLIDGRGRHRKYLLSKLSLKYLLKAHDVHYSLFKLRNICSQL